MALRKIPFLLSVLIVSALILVGCGNEGDSFQNISLEEVHHEIGKTTIIDVRTPSEFVQGHIPGAINIPLDAIENNIDVFKEYDSFILICKSGNRSKQASELLADNGVTGFLNAEKGMASWSYEVSTN